MVQIFSTDLDLSHHQQLIEIIIASHLGLSPDVCHLVNLENWIDGSFNVCVCRYRHPKPIFQEAGDDAASTIMPSW
ncbi:hypothetical protein N7499_005429 [Penicillium canescens]|uniref:Uncharacterized protein n=1 Tax=Penicillium canescens TaxID=5083 RepID=A0AAD6NCK8_PENCN|nr:uncharacterized protein N7446_010899 [Penicillium canescens]KAJ6007232.1 hypothetical protein N7522_005583 [Penicillium canescens]KAJ6029751.1 hypothetical protein N7444_012738 [Penicillium canescens]KAJ6048183.1 hypothetical protein N7460_004330 [Penicillium canescens]KAJ6048216.1 hypothetical protein N7446_010899 [Penicillium canescens]KAJ6085800.1 hypothetical protein N7499_005429 [Penicillium canescens]